MCHILRKLAQNTVIALTNKALAVRLTPEVKKAFGFSQDMFRIGPAVATVNIMGNIEKFEVVMNSLENLQQFANSLNGLNIPQPFHVKASQTGTTIDLKYSKQGLAITLPDVCSYYTIKKVSETNA